LVKTICTRNLFNEKKKKTLCYYTKLKKNSQLSRQAGRGWRSVVSANRLIFQFPIPSFTVEIIYIITTIFITFLFTSIWNDKSECSDISFQMQHCFRTYITKPKCGRYIMWMRSLLLRKILISSFLRRNSQGTYTTLPFFACTINY